MSRIGKKPVSIVNGAKVSVSGRTVEVEGPKGKLAFEHRPEVSVAVDQSANQVVVSRDDDERPSREFHGLTRAVIANMIEGVTKGYEKRLEIVGVGYLAAIQGDTLQVRGLCQRTASKNPRRLEGHLPRSNAHRDPGLRQAESRSVRRGNSLTPQT